MKDLDLEGRHVVVTGGAGALGHAVVKRLLALGAVCHVPCVDRAELERFDLADRLRVEATAPVDLGDPRQVNAYYEALDELWASIHCAGGFSMADISAIEDDDFRRMMRLNAETAFWCCRAAVRAMRATDPAAGGRIVNVAARVALEPREGAGKTAYAMSKAAVAALTQGLAEELADDAVWINAVAPSILDTPANRDAMPDADHTRWPTTAEVAETIVFLASPLNRSTRGGVLPVYGKS
ncbi:MAG: SDR family NAD(P)-dependent oxidoreductase [Acidobacteriota bacterium]